MPWAWAIALRNGGATRPSVTVATPSRMNSRRDTRMVVMPLHELIFGGADEQACEPGGARVELLARAVPRSGRLQVRHQRLPRSRIERRRGDAIEHGREQRLRRGAVGLERRG